MDLENLALEPKNLDVEQISKNHDFGIDFHEPMILEQISAKP